MKPRYTTLIDVETLAGLCRESEGHQIIIIDCRFSLADPAQGHVQWRDGHIPGACHAHLDDDLSGKVVAGLTGRHPLPDRESLAARFRHWGISHESQVVCYDNDAGAFASRFWWLSRWLGHEACAVLDGGFRAWKNAGEPVTTESSEPTAGDFTIRDSLVQVIGIDEVARGDHQLVDAREAARFRGEVEPIDPVAGHIPDAINLPFQANLASDGHWLAAGKLQARFQPLLNAAGDKPIAHYCGSGVTAAHNVLAMAHAGLRPGALYAGSWSEWINHGSAHS